MPHDTGTAASNMDEPIRMRHRARQHTAPREQILEHFERHARQMGALVERAGAAHARSHPGGIVIHQILAHARQRMGHGYACRLQHGRVTDARQLQQLR